MTFSLPRQLRLISPGRRKGMPMKDRLLRTCIIVAADTLADLSAIVREIKAQSEAPPAPPAEEARLIRADHRQSLEAPPTVRRRFMASVARRGSSPDRSTARR
jgi:hypothetical protein